MNSRSKGFFWTVTVSPWSMQQFFFLICLFELTNVVCEMGNEKALTLC
jgi:hypothetical protein